jgi:hypothetical protein
MSLCGSGTIADPHADVCLLGRGPEVGNASLANTNQEPEGLSNQPDTPNPTRWLNNTQSLVHIETWMGRSPSPNDLVSEIVDGTGGPQFSISMIAKNNNMCGVQYLVLRWVLFINRNPPYRCWLEGPVTARRLNTPPKRDDCAVTQSLHSQVRAFFEKRAGASPALVDFVVYQ